MKKIIACVSLTLCIILLTNSVWAGGDTTAKSSTATVVLVQLRSEKNRIKAMEKNHAYRPLEEVKKDAEEVRNRTIKDFTYFFKKCPVYYFMDTNTELIVKKQFDGVLLDASLTPCNCHPEEPYLIVNWGYPTVTTRRGVTDGDSTAVATNGEPNGKGLIINDERFQQLTYIYILGYQAAIIKRSKNARPYVYESKHYDIDYFPVADKFDDQFDHLHRAYNTSWNGLWLSTDKKADTSRHK